MLAKRYLCTYIYISASVCYICTYKINFDVHINIQTYRRWTVICGTTEKGVVSYDLRTFVFIALQNDSAYAPEINFTS